MTRNDDFIGQLEGYLDEYEGSTPLPTDVRDAIRAQLPSISQRPAWWPAGRFPEMNNTAKLAVVAAAVVVVVVAGLGFGLMQVGTTGHDPSQAPSPSAIRTSPAQFPGFPGPPRPVDAGIYSVGSDWFQAPVTVSFVVPAGWLSCTNNAGLLCPADGTGGVNIWVVTNVVADPCDNTALRNPAVGPTVEDLVTAISSLPWSAITPPTAITVDGFRGMELEVAAPPSSPCVGMDGFATWTTTLTPEMAADVSPGERIRLRILDVDGTRVVIEGYYAPGTTSSQDLAEINAIIDSVRIEP
jgi:hypothetical protein